jgi:alpha,alpha-trehalose-phosphate synthase [UDP-forming]
VRLLSVRLIVSLMLGIILVSWLSAYYQVRAQKRVMRQTLERDAEIFADSLAENIEPHFAKGSRRLQKIVEKYGSREHLLGVAVYDRSGGLMAITPGLTHRLASEPPLLSRAVAENRGQGQFVSLNGSPVHIYALPLHQDDQVVGGLALVYDAGYIAAQTRGVWRDAFVRVLILGCLISLTTLLIVRFSITGPIAKAALWMKALRTGRASAHPYVPDIDLLRPLAREMTNFAESLTAARSAAEKEAQLREAAESLWTAERLSVHVRAKLGSSRLFVVSNREPYFHTRTGKTIEAVVPASGLVTALQPVLCACDGTWIAHGSGNADREMVDAHDRLRVPPDEPRYTLRRVWLSKEEEEGYYYGFANEGLWPLSHIAHTRPIFRVSDWEYYRAANRKFADAVLQEMEGTDRPLLLAQDYHFALLPRMVKERRPDARVAIFWHIPWPNPEAFAICPWQRELLHGLLGADLIGFHIQSHCTNFLQTVDRALESRIEWDHFAVNREEHRTLVKPFPISVEYTEPAPDTADQHSMYLDRGSIFRELGIESVYMGVGVDRVDYTKGIPERFLAIERLLEKHPHYREKFTFIQLAAPSRTHIKRYHDLLAEVELEAERINWRFQTGKWKPIVYLKGQHTHEVIQRFYKTADLCLVTSLHDGMNLVAKEFLAARSDDQGVLILSRFAGAARELEDALLVNPYDIDQTAEAIRFALEMKADEREARMRRMRQQLRERNIYRWAGNLIGDLCEVRLDLISEPRPAERAGAA